MVLLMLSIGGSSGCDIPTEVPRWDTRWVIPAEGTSFAVADLLPADISVAANGDAFEARLPAISFSQSLREMCEGCAAVDGLTIPKPPFTVSFGSEVGLPAALLSARLVAGEMQIRIQHDFPFDPLRPSATARGFLILTVRSGSALLARDSLSGNTTALPRGTIVTRDLSLQPQAISDPIEIGITLFSPAGDPVLIDVEDRLTVEVPATQVEVSDTRILVSDLAISTRPIQLELGEIDAAVSERVESGAINLQIENPFDISGTFELRITSAAAPIVKTVEIPSGASSSRIELSGEELRSILGVGDVQLSISGRASSPPEGTAVEPTEEIGIGARLELVIRSGGD